MSEDQVGRRHRPERVSRATSPHWSNRSAFDQDLLVRSYPDVERRFILTIRCQGREEVAVLATADLVRERAGRLAR